MFYRVMLKLKDQEHMVGIEDTEMEADAYARGWAQAIITHVGSAEPDTVINMFTVEKITEEPKDEKR